MAWWNATSVTISNNQNVVVVNAADNIGLINDGDALVLAGQIVEIDRAYFDNNNAPRILLKSNWTSGNQTNQPAKAVPIPADLRRAVQYLRDVGQDAITFSEAMAQILSSTAATLIIPTATSGDVTVVPYGRLVQQVNDLLATMGTFGVPLYGTNSRNQARTLMGLQPQVTAQPTLDLDFANNEYRIYELFGLTRKTLTEAITAARNSVANYSSPFGIAQAAVNTPRIEFNPATGECLGLLCEEQRTNLCLWSEQFDNSWWEKTGTTVEADAELSPNLTNTADKIVETSTNAVHRIQRPISNLPGSEFSASIFVKGDGSRKIGLTFGSADLSSFGCAIVNPSNGQATVSGAGAAVRNIKVEKCANGYFRVNLNVSNIAASSHRLIVSILTSTATDIFATHQGDGTSGIYIWGAQLEAGSFPTSYIKTEGSQVTRVGESLTSNATRALEGVLFVNAIAPVNTNFNSVLALGSSSTEEARISFRTATGQTSLTAVIRTGETNTSTGDNTIQAGAKFKFALRYKAVSTGIEWTGFCNGIKNLSVTSSSFPVGFFTTPIKFGARASVNTLFWNGTIANAKIIPLALTDQELIDLTRL